MKRSYLLMLVFCFLLSFSAVVLAQTSNGQHLYVSPKVIDDYKVTIKGEKKSEKEEKGRNYHFMERSCGSFSRSVGLPASVKFEQVKAEYKKGILEITLPKSEKSKIKKIPVKVS